MGQRLQLQSLLEQLISDQPEDKLHVYFQPPNNISMQYPCIVYARDKAEIKFADNKPYQQVKRYQVTVIDQNPDSELPGKVAALPLCSFDRFYTADNLNHDVFNIFF